jgi:hypothetical protein
MSARFIGFRGKADILSGYDASHGNPWKNISLLIPYTSLSAAEALNYKKMASSLQWSSS